MENEDIEEVAKVASQILSSLVSVDVIRCKDCKYFERYGCGKYVITNPSPDDYCSKAKKRAAKTEREG